MRFVLTIAAFCCALLPVCARATPEYARRTLLSCNACHAVGTALTEFGTAFKLDGYRVPHLLKGADVPVFVSAQGVYSSEPDPTGLPKTIVDEVDYLSAGALGKHFNYGAEVYNLDGGTVGSAREGWLEYLSTQREALPVQIRAGLQVLPIPVDPERFRETNAHYAIYDQTAGNNPFTFFDPHEAIRFGFGNDSHGTHFDLIASDPHGVMTAIEESSAKGVAEIYRYDGTQPVFGASDRFWRQGYSASLYDRRFSMNAVLQSGWDANGIGDGTGVMTSGGFLQARMQVAKHAFAIARYDGVNDSQGNFARSFTFGAGTLFLSAFRLEIEDQVFHAPQTHNALGIVLRTGIGTIHEGGFAY